MACLLEYAKAGLLWPRDRWWRLYSLAMLPVFLDEIRQARPRGYKTFFMLNSTMQFFLLINVKMPTIVGILTFMNRKKMHSRII